MIQTIDNHFKITIQLCRNNKGYYKVKNCGIKQYLRILIYLNYVLLSFKFTKISDINK